MAQSIILVWAGPI